MVQTLRLGPAGRASGGQAPERDAAGRDPGGGEREDRVRHQSEDGTRPGVDDRPRGLVSGQSAHPLTVPAQAGELQDGGQCMGAGYRMQEGNGAMGPRVQRTKRLLWLGILLVSVLRVAGVTAALEVGEPAPDFTLPSTIGEQISLSQFRGSNRCSWSSMERTSHPSERRICRPGRRTTASSRRCTCRSSGSAPTTPFPRRCSPTRSSSPTPAERQYAERHQGIRCPIRRARREERVPPYGRKDCQTVVLPH